MLRSAGLAVLAVSVLMSSQALALRHARSLSGFDHRGALSLSERTERGGYAGWLTGAPSAFASTSLLAVGSHYGQAAEPAPAATMDPREALAQEKAELQASMPGLGMPIGLLAGGAAGFFIGYIMMVVGAELGSGIVALIGLGLVVVGVVAIVLGVIRLVGVIRNRAAATRRISEIDDQLNAMPGGMPPPPPSYAPPPAVQREGNGLPVAGIRVASF